MTEDMRRVSSRREQQRLEGEHVEPAAMTLTPERLGELEFEASWGTADDFFTIRLDDLRALIAAARKVPELEAENRAWTNAFNKHDDALAAQNAMLREAGTELFTMSGVAAKPNPNDGRLSKARVKMEEALDTDAPAALAEHDRRVRQAVWDEVLETKLWLSDNPEEIVAAYRALSEKEPDNG